MRIPAHSKRRVKKSRHSKPKKSTRQAKRRTKRSTSRKTSSKAKSLRKFKRYQKSILIKKPKATRHVVDFHLAVAPEEIYKKHNIPKVRPQSLPEDIPTSYRRVFESTWDDYPDSAKIRFNKEFNKIFKKEKPSLKKLFFMKFSCNLLKNDTYEIQEKYIPSSQIISRLEKDIEFFRLDRISKMLKPILTKSQSRLFSLLMYETKSFFSDIANRHEETSFEHDFFKKLIQTLNSNSYSEFFLLCDNVGTEQKKIELLLKERGLLQDFKKEMYQKGKN